MNSLRKKQVSRNRITERETHIVIDQERLKENQKEAERQRQKKDTLRHTYGAIERSTQTEAHIDTERDRHIDTL